MTRRRVYFHHDLPTAAYFYTEEFNGDKAELEQFGSSDKCSMTWAEMLQILKGVATAASFLDAVSAIRNSYKSAIPSRTPGPRIFVTYEHNDIPAADEVYGIVCDSCEHSVFLDRELSILSEEGAS